MAPSIPTPWTLKVRRRVEDVLDDFGNPTVPDDRPETDWPVYFIQPGAMDEPTTQPGVRDLSVVAFTVGSPRSDAAPTEYDEVQVDGEWFQVVGRPKDWTRGPWGYAPGITVELEVKNG